MNNYNLGAIAGNPDDSYIRTMTVVQEDFIGPADKGPLTLDTVGDILRSR